MRLRRDELGLTQKQIVTRLARCGLHTTNRALSSLEHGAGIDVAFTARAVVAAQVFVSSPFYIRAVRVGFQGMDSTIEEAAAVDGATGLRAFLHILILVCILGGLYWLNQFLHIDEAIKAPSYAFWLRYCERQGLSGDGLNRLRDTLGGHLGDSSRPVLRPGNAEGRRARLSRAPLSG